MLIIPMVQLIKSSEISIEVAICMNRICIGIGLFISTYDMFWGYFYLEWNVRSPFQ